MALECKYCGTHLITKQSGTYTKMEYQCKKNHEKMCDENPRIKNWYSDFDSDEEFRKYLQDKHEENVGTRDFEKALKRYDMLFEWREEKDVCN